MSGIGPDLQTAAYIKQISAAPPPGSPYALPLPGTEREGRSPIYRHWHFRDKPLLDTLNPEIRTFHDLFHDSVKRYPNNKCLGTRPWDAATKQWENRYVWQTYAEVATRAKNFGAGIYELHRRIGVPPGNHGVGLWSQNRAEWQIADLGLSSQSIFSVSLYESLGPDASEYIIKHSDLACVVSSLPHIPTLLALAPRIPTLKLIICMDPLDAGEQDGYSKMALLNGIAAQHGIQIWSMDGVEELGARLAHPIRPPRPEDIITINYTSGTTGDPKGVVLTQANCVAAIASSRSSAQYTSTDVHVSYLPVAHIYGRLTDQCAFAAAAAVGYFHGNMLELVDDLKILKPTGFMSVPRLFNRFNMGIQAQTIEADGIKGALSRRAIDAKTASMKLPPGQAHNKHFLYDRIWTPKVRAAVGLDRCRHMVSGSAQLDPDVQEFLRAALGNEFSQGYGLTESYAATSFQAGDDFTLGNVGYPLPGTEICLESQPDLEYLVTDKPRPRGELLLRGTLIFREYHKNEEETKKALEPDGWFHTGDIAEIDEMGRIRIVDRKKNVLKLSQGEYISPERIENVYMGSSHLIATAYVHGEPSQSTLVGIFGVDPVAFGPFASKILKKDIAADDLQAIKAAGRDPRVVKAFIKQLDVIGKKHKFNGFERVRNCLLDVDPFTVENELLTPTLKLKRPQTARKFKADIDRMYAEINAEPTDQGEYIDLTLDDDDEDGCNTQIAHESGLLPSIAPSFISGANINGQYSNHLTTIPPARPNPPLHITGHHNGFRSQSSSASPSRQAQDRPSKRRKLHDETSVADKKLLTKCLQGQVFPHLERGLANLDKNIYDVEKLGGKIIGRIADKEFERHFRNGNGLLPAEVEETMASRIQSLMSELTRGVEFRRFPASDLNPAPIPPPRRPQNSASVVVPSIEDVSNEPPLDETDVDEQDHFDHLEDSERVEPQYIQTPPTRTRPKRKPLITPQQLRTRVKATQWQSGRAYESKKEGSPVNIKNRWFSLSSRPYLTSFARQQVATGAQNGPLLALQPGELREPATFHVDFSDEEVKYICPREPVCKTYAIFSRRIYAGYQRPPLSLLKRSTSDISNFLDDLYYRQLAIEPTALFVSRDDWDARGDVSRASKVPSLLLAREITGNRLGATRRYQNFTTTFKSNREDFMEPKVEWTNCAGDIMTISWLSNTHFVCGTTTHSDSHNQQYNKPGNLLLGSTISHTLKAYPDHRIPRPIVSHGDNALEAMRESQDPWLFTSVVSSDYSRSNDVAFTSSFDNTVKVWKSRGEAMELVDTWPHDGRVNFVVASEDGMVATAADVPTKAVRVYDFVTRTDSSGSTFHGEDYVPSDKWAYFPAAIRWGLAPSVTHLLLIGYSPRSLCNDDNEIPEDKRDTGELCLWDTIRNTEVKVNSAATQNVFEVAWHPSRTSFAAATSASQTSEKIEEHVRTHIRIFELNETGQYGAVKTLDCPAIDINELAIRPNSTLYSYVAAGCTDGKVYVWDSAGSDQPMCVLKHGDPVEELLGDREHEDVGVKFTAWGTTADRLYTGSSDGVVKVWNIRHGKEVLVKDLIEVAAPITFGAFSPDYTKLVIGDGSGRVYLLALEEEDGDDVTSKPLTIQLNGGVQRSIRRPRPFIPHGELPHPDDNEDNRKSSGPARAKEYLKNHQLILRRDATIGAVQGPSYSETGLYRAEAHLDGDVNGPLLSGFENLQQANRVFSRVQRHRRQRAISEGPQGAVHAQNTELDLDVESFDTETRSRLEAERAELNISPQDLDYESSYSE
ncbi:hypothetical protein F4779DRAFT_625438 [Xylariaceae sp. FL0662B]|nr:hypothetical protein F4779DRAFT_625438 [Xylariaceae sp. FL0662B]